MHYYHSNKTRVALATIEVPYFESTASGAACVS